MTVHLHMQHQCENEDCGCLYIPYNESILCPSCGSKAEMDDYFPLIEGICESFLHNLHENKSFFPSAWITMDISDVLQMFMFSIFEKWVLEHPSATEESRDEDFKSFAEEIIDMIDFKGDGHIRSFIRQAIWDVYHRFFHEMEIVLIVKDDDILIEGETDGSEGQTDGSGEQT